MRVSHRHHLLIALLAFLVLLPALSRADAVGTVSKIEGAVDILRSKQTEAELIHVGDTVGIGDAVRTKRSGRAEIRFNDGSVMQLAPETRIVIDEYSFWQTGTRRRSLMSLFRGKIRAIITRIKAAAMTVSETESSFDIKTPTAVAGVKGTDFIVYYERGVTGVIFLDGSGYLYNLQKPDRVVPIKAGQAAFVTSEEDVPQDAVPVSDEFVAPFLQDTAVGVTARDLRIPPQLPEKVDVLTSNTTHAALVDPGSAGERVAQTPAGGALPGIVHQFGSISAPPAAANTMIPITTTYPALLGTPVNLTFPVP